MAHPLRGDVAANLARSLRWLAWLRWKYPAFTFVAPWIASIMSGQDDGDPADRMAGLADAQALIPRLDGVVLVGGAFSSGMDMEASWSRDVYDMTGLGPEPPRRDQWPLLAPDFQRDMHTFRTTFEELCKIGPRCAPHAQEPSP